MWEAKGLGLGFMSIGLLGATKQATPPVDLGTLTDFRGVLGFHHDPTAREKGAVVGLRQGHKENVNNS